MKIQTTVGQFKCSPKQLFELLSKEVNLPTWATLYCRSIEKKGDDYIIDTPEGKMFVEHSYDEKTGVIDMKAGPTRENMWNTPTRVVSDNMGGSLFIFTLIQAPGQPDDDFENGCKGLAHEFEIIKGIVEK